MKIFGKRREHLGSEALSEYLSGGLPTEEARQLEGHVQACPECREELDSLRYTVGLLRRVPMVAPRTTYTLSEAPAAAPSAGRVSWLPGWAYGAAASVAVLMFALVLSADVTGLLAEDVATPEVRIVGEDVPTFAVEAPEAAPAPEVAETIPQAAAAQLVVPEAEVVEVTVVVEAETEVEAGQAAAEPANVLEMRAAEVVDDGAEVAAGEKAPEAGVQEALPGIESLEAEPPVAPVAAAPAPVADGVAAAEDLEVEEISSAEAVVATTAPEAMVTEAAAAPVMEDAAPVTAAAKSVEPETAVAAPTEEFGRAPGAPTEATVKESTSVLWRVLEGVLGGLALVMVAALVWLRRRRFSV